MEYHGAVLNVNDAVLTFQNQKVNLGDFEDYFQMIQDNDKMCGGFVWEWCDHAIAHGTAESGKTIYAYGGDHGEEIHDGNFCMDGLVYPDRTVHTGPVSYTHLPEGNGGKP